VGNVDSFQGQERGISAITLTRIYPQNEIGFLPDIRRMNVGLTRARHKLLMVGYSSTLCCHPFFWGMLAQVKGVGVTHSALDGPRYSLITALEFLQTLYFRTLVREPYSDSYIETNLYSVPLVATCVCGVVHEDLFRELSYR